MTKYEQRKATGQYWFNKASDLRGAAAAVWFSLDPDLSQEVVKRADLGDGFCLSVAVGPVYFMLCGMALELLFKAIVVESGLPVEDTHHDLVRYASAAKLSYADHDKGLLKILSHSVAWEGRYPVPKKEAHMEELQNLTLKMLFERVPMGTMTTLQRTDDLDWKSFSALWSVASERFFEIRGD